MKKFIAGFIIGAMLFGALGVFAATYVAQPATFKVLVNGKEFVSEPPALVVEGKTYLPLRAIGDAIGVPVNWNEELKQAEVGKTIPKESVSQSNENTSGYITYKEKPWCPDFGMWVGKTPYADFAVEEDNSHCYVYKANGITMNDIKGYMKIFYSMGYKVGTITNGYACKDENGIIKMGIKVNNNEIMLLVY